MFGFTKVKFFLFAILCLGTVLRIYSLNLFPPSLYSDEANQGYNAYSLLLTGRDEHGKIFPVSLRSFGDWKPPLQTYLMIPFIYVFGLNEFSVRISSSILGVLSICLGYLLSFILLGNVKYRQKISLISAFILSVSPWHLLESRSAMLVIVAFFLLEFGVYLFLLGKNSNKLYYFGTFFLWFSVYAYYANRVIVPLIAVFLIFFCRLYEKKEILVKSIVIASAVLLPLIISFISNPDVIFGRAKTVSVLHDKGTDLRLWELISQDGINTPSYVARFFHNRPHLYFKKILGNFFSHFELNYLLFAGDSAQPFNTPGIGIIYLLDLLCLGLGMYLIFKKKMNSRLLLIPFLIVAFLPASLTFMVPASNRTFNAVYPLSLLIALGMVYLISYLRWRKLTALIFSIIYSVNILYFLNIYFIKIPAHYQHIWNFGWKEAVAYVNRNAGDSENIIISGKNGMPYTYFLFYNKYDPLKFQKTAVRDYSSDRFGFENVDSFGKYYFPLELDWINIKDNHLNSSLYIIPANELPEKERSGDEIKFSNGSSAIRIFKYD